MPVVYIDPGTGHVVLRPMFWNLTPDSLGTWVDVQRWNGLAPWVGGKNDGKHVAYFTSNVRIERATDKRASAYEAWQFRRGLIVLDGFIEWCGDKGKRKAHLIRRRDQKSFAMAGIWEHWTPKKDHPEDADRELWSCSVVVGDADDWFRPYHASPDGKNRQDRMPRILLPELHSEWLNPDLVDPDLARRLLLENPYPSDELIEVVEIDAKRVNNPWYDAADCLERLSPTPTLF